MEKDRKHRRTKKLFHFAQHINYSRGTSSDRLPLTDTHGFARVPLTLIILLGLGKSTAIVSVTVSYRIAPLP